MNMSRGGGTAGNTQDAFFPRSAAVSMPTIVGGRGVYLTDDSGRELIDVCSGPFLAALGQGNERVIEAMARQARQLTYTYSRSTRHPANAEFSARLTQLAGPGFERAHLTSGGSEANEMAVKMLRARAVAFGEAERTRVISLMPGYHGATVQTLAMNGDVGARPLWDPLTVAAERVRAPLTYRAASPQSAAAESLAELESAISRLGPERVLAVIVEPIGGQASGVNVPDESFARGVRALCSQNGIALVFDEVVTGMRTGAFLAAHHQPDVRPDIVTMAKGLGAGYAPLGAVLTSAEFADSLADSTGFVVSHSYDANPIACAAGSAVLDEVVDRGLIAAGESVGARIRAGIDAIAQDSTVIGDVRGRGLLLAIELVVDRTTQQKFAEGDDPGAVLIQRGLERGLLLYSRRQNKGRYGDWILVAPPLVMDSETADVMVDRLAEVLDVNPDQLSSARG